MAYFRLKNLFKFNWKLGLSLILLFGIPRFLLVLDANQTRSYNFVSIVFIVMWITPFVFLTREGRKFIGMVRTNKYAWLVYSFLLGIAACTIAFFIGKWLYHQSNNNWFVYISNSYGAIPTEALQGNSKHIYFIIFALIGMTFSPIGEELLYRGLIHQSFVRKFGNNRASIIDSLAFTIVHLAHFGIIYVNGNWEVLIIPAILWLTLMFFTSRMFFFCKSKSESIYGAILSHAGFNLTMTFFIFYYML